MFSESDLPQSISRLERSVKLTSLIYVINNDNVLFVLPNANSKSEMNLLTKNQAVVFIQLTGSSGCVVVELLEVCFRLIRAFRWKKEEIINIKGDIQICAKLTRLANPFFLFVDLALSENLCTYVYQGY